MDSICYPARIAVTLALGHKIEQAIDTGVVADRAEIAHQFGLTRARVTYIVDLLLLLPDIQEHVLDIEAIDGR